MSGKNGQKLGRYCKWSAENPASLRRVFRKHQASRRRRSAAWKTATPTSISPHGKAMSRRWAKSSTLFPKTQSSSTTPHRFNPSMTATPAAWTSISDSASGSATKSCGSLFRKEPRNNIHPSGATSPHYRSASSCPAAASGHRAQDKAHPEPSSSPTPLLP